MSAFTSSHSFVSRNARRLRKADRRRAMFFEGLEDRSLMATINDPGFETNVLAANQFIQAATIGTSPWAFGPGSGITRNTSGFQGGGITAPEGQQFGLMQSGGSITQNGSAFVVGDLYSITIAASARSGPNQARVAVNVDGLNVLGGRVNWFGFQDLTTATFKATSTNPVIQITSTNYAGGDNTLFVDNLRLNTLAAPTTPTLSNPSFESFPITSFPDYEAFSGWGSTSQQSGTNGAGGPFLNGLAIPNGSRIGFAQGAAKFTQTITGLTAGRQYQVSFVENERGSGGTALARSSVLVDGNVVLAEHDVVRSNNWRRVLTQPFVATSSTAVLEIWSDRVTPGVADHTLLIDDVQVLSDTAAPLIAEGGFENPVQPANDWEQANGTGGGSLVGSQWTLTGGAGITRNTSAFQNGGIQAPEGGQFALIQYAGSLTQTVSGFQVGSVYNAAFAAAARSAGGGNDLKIILDEGLPTEFTIYNNPEVTPTAFTNFNSSSFIAQKASYTVTLRGTRTDSDRTTFVDDLRFAAVSGGTHNITLKEIAGADFYNVDGGTDFALQGTSYVFSGTSGNDTLTVDFSGGNPLPSGGVTFNGGSQTGSPGDGIVLTGGTTTSITHSFVNNSDGSITLAGALAGSITYTGLEPITDNLGAADRIFTFTGGAETIAVTDSAGANVTRIDSTLGEFVDFVTPTNSLTINTNGGDTTNFTAFDALFNTPTIILNDPTAISVFQLGAANIVPDATSLTVNNNATFNTNGFSDTINGLAGNGRVNNAAAGAATLTVGSANATSTFTGLIQNTGGALTLTKIGTGQLELGGANTFTGGLNVNGGRIFSRHASALGGGTSMVNVAAGSYVMLWWNTGSNIVTNNWTLNGLGATQLGEEKDTIYADGAGGGFREFVLSGTIMLNATSDIGGHNINNVRVTGQITGPGGLTKGSSRGDENSTLTLTNSANNYQGATRVRQGKLKLAADNLIPDGASAGGVIVDAGRTLDLGEYNETINNLSGGGNVIRGGTIQPITTFTTDAGTGVSNTKTYTHLLDFQAGGTPATVNGVAFVDAGLTGGNWTLTGATLAAGNAATGMIPASGTGMHALLSDFWYNGNPGLLTLTGLTPGTTYETRLYQRVWGGPRTVTATFDEDGAGPASSVLFFDQDGTASPNYLAYRFTASTTSLTINIAQGSASYHWYGLSNEEVSPSVTPTLTVGDATTAVFAGSFTGKGNVVKVGTGSQTIGGSATASVPTGFVNYTGTTTISAGTLVLQDPYGFQSDITNNSALAFHQTQNQVVINNPITGSGTVTKTGTAGVIFAGTSANSYAGVTTVSDGFLLLGKTPGVNAIGGELVIGDADVSGENLILLASNQIPDTAAVTVNGNGLLSLQDFDESIGSLTGSGNIDRKVLGPTLFTTDAGSGISTAKTYTHLLDFVSDGSAAVVNGVAFTPAATSLGGSHAITGATITFNEAGVTPTLMPGLTAAGMNKLYSDFYYSFNSLSLSGLTAGTTYEMRMYLRQFGSIFDRTQTMVFDEDGTGPQTSQFTFNEDATATPSYISYRYTAVSDGAGGTRPLIVNVTPAIGGNTFHMYGLTNEAVSSLPVAGTLTLTGNASTLFNGRFSGNGNVVKQGTGTLTLQGSLINYTGATTINAGAVTFTDVNVLSGDIINNTTLNLNQTVGQATFSGAISGPGVLNKTGAGAVILGGATSNTYGGLTTVSEGGLYLAKTSGNAIGGNLTVGDGDVNAELVRANGNNQIADTANVVVNTNGTLDLSIFTETLATLSGDGNVVRQKAGVTTFNTDAGTEVSPQKTYTHLLDFAAGGSVALVNGVQFVNAGNTGGNWTLTGATSSTANAATGMVPPSGPGMHTLLEDFYYDGNPAVLTLSGLVVGQTYETRLYQRVWGGPRNVTAVFDEDGAGPASTTFAFDADAAANPSFVSYRYTAGATSMTVSISHVGASYHWYGMSNELVTTASGTPSLTVGDATNFAFTGSLTGTGPLTKVGAGQMTLQGAGIAYTGLTTISDGTLQLTDTPNVANNNIVDNANLIFNQTAGGYTFNAAISGTGTLTKTGAGTITLAGSTGNTYAGLTTVSEGVLLLNKSSGNAIGGDLTIGDADANVETVQLLANNQIPDTSTVTVNSNGVLDFNARTDTVAGLNGDGSVLLPSFTPANGLIASQTFTDDATSGISSAKTYSHLLDFGSDGITPTINGVTFTAVGATGPGFSIVASAGGPMLSHPGGGAAILASGNVVPMLNDFVYNGNPALLTLTGLTPGVQYETRVYTRRWDPSARPVTVTWDEDGVGPASTSVSFDEDLSQTTPYYFGYRFTAVATSLTANFLPTGGGTFHFYGLSNEVIPSGVSSLTLNGTGVYSFGGVISGVGSVTKQNTGVQTLGGANTYTGLTTINGGRLNVNGSLVDTPSDPDVIVNSTGTLGGTGVVSGTVSVASGGAVSPGVTTGVLTSGATTFVVGASFNVDLDGTTVSTQYDQLIVNGGVNLGGATLNLAGVHVPLASTLETFVIIANDGVDVVNGTFAGLAEGAATTLNGGTLYISYKGGDGNDVVLRSQPLALGTAGADTVLLTATPTGYTYQLNADPAIAIVGTTTFNFDGLAADDLLIVQLAAAAVMPNIVYNGGGQDFVSRPPASLGDVLRVIGTNAETATYVGDGVVNVGLDNDGTVAIGGQGTIAFTQLEPVDLQSMATANINFANAADVVALDDGLDSTATNPALIVSGTSNGVAFEQVHLRNNTNVVLHTVTGGSDGNDAITINSGVGAHGNVNLTIDTGAGTDTVTVAGAISVTGAVTITSQTIAVNALLTAGAASTVTLTASGAVTTSGAGVDIAALSLLANAATGIDLDTDVMNLTATTSGAGSITLDEANGANVLNVAAANGDATVTSATGNLAVTTASASGTVTLTATAGAITDANAAANNVTATLLNVTGATGVDLDTTIAQLTAASTNAAIVIRESNGVVVNTVNAGTGTVTLTLTAGAIGDNNGAGTLNVTAGLLDANAPAGIDLDTEIATLTAASLNSLIAIREATGVAVNTVNAGTANVTLTLTAGAVTDNNGVGTVNVTAALLEVTGPGGIDLDTTIATLTAAATNSAVVIRETDALAVNTAAAGTGMVSLAAGGAVTDGNAGLNNVSAASLLVTAVGGIALDTTVGQLAAANSGSGDILITNTGALNITTLSEPSIGSVSGVLNPAGAVTVIALSPLSVNSPVSALGAVILTATDSGVAGDDLAVNATVTSTGSSVTLNAGDNATISANLSASSTVAINIDAGDQDPLVGATLNIPTGVVITATSATFTGATQADAFNFAPQVSTPINVFGLAPFANPGGDTMLVDTAAPVTNPTLNILGGQGAGLYTFGNRANVQYASIENATTTTPIHSALDSTATLVENIRLQRSTGGGTDFEVYDTDTTNLLYAGPILNVLSFLFLGSANANTVAIDDVNGLVDLAGTVPAPTGVGDNTNVTGTPEIFLRGNGGTDAIVFANTANATDQIYGFGTGTAPGSQAGEVYTTNAALALSVYFDGIEGVTSNDATPADVGTLTIVGDAAANAISLASSAGGTTVSATGYVPFTFAPQAFNAAIVNAGDGNDSITLVSLNAAESGLALALNGQVGADTITVQSASAGNTLALQGGVDNDTYQLGGAANTVDNILVPITIADTSGVDSLTLVDSADLSGDVVAITDSTIDGVNAAPSPNVSFSAIENLDVTTSGGIDSITTTLNGTNGLVTANVRGAGGDDDFFLNTADGMTTLTTINLVGDAGNDEFGSAMAPIRPLAGTTTNVFIYGDTTAITTNPGGAVTDRLVLDMTTTSAGAPTNPLVIVDTVTGQATTASTRLLRFGGIEDIDLYDGGQLTDVVIGDLYLRATDGVDNLVFYRENGGVFVKRNGVPVSATPYAPTNRIVSYGRAGNDYMEFNFTLGSTLSADFRGENDNDTLVGGLGNDLLVGGGGHDNLKGGEGADVLYGEDQFLTSSPISFADQRRTGLVQSATGGNDTLDGGGGNDFLFGGTGADVMTGGLGNDYVHGGEGNDTLNSAGGNDILRGENGADLINGATGNDILLGGEGDDRIFGRGNRDFMLAGAGADQIQDDEASNDVVVAGGLLQDNDDAFVGGSLFGLNDYDLALQAMMFTGANAWSGAATFAARVGNLTPLTAIINDTVADIILGNVAGQDYIISNTNDMRLNTAGDQLLTV